MATKTIGATARQYATIALWESYLDGGGNSGSAGVLGEAEIGECYNDSEFDEAVDFSGYTTSATNTVTLRPATGQGFRDAGTKRLAYDQSKGVAWKRGGGVFTQVCTIQVDYFTLFGMQLKGTSAYINYDIYIVGSTFEAGSLANTKVDSCILTHTFRSFCVNMRSGKLINCLAYNDTTGTNVAVDMPTFQNVDVYGCTIARTSNNSAVGTALGDGSGYGRAGTIKNCAIFGFTTTWGPDSTWTSQSYCATDQASFPAAVTGGVTSLTFASQFVDSSNVSTDFIALSSGGLKAGTPDATNTPVDIFGTARDATTPYIGCYEVPGGAAAATLSAVIGAARIAARGVGPSVQRFLFRTPVQLFGGVKAEPQLGDLSYDVINPVLIANPLIGPPVMRRRNRRQPPYMPASGPGGPNAYQQALTAALSFAGAAVIRTSRALTAALNFVGAITKRTLTAKTAALSFVGAFATNNAFIKLMTAALSFSGAQSRSAAKSLSGALSFVGAQTRSTVHSMTAALSFVGSLTKRTTKAAMTAALSFVGNLLKGNAFVRALTASLSFAGALSTGSVITKALTAALSFSGAQARSVGKSIAGSLSFAGAITRRTSHAMTAALSFVGSVVRRVSTARTAALSFIGSLTTGQAILKAFTAALSFVGAISTRRGKIFTAALSFSGSVTRRISFHLASSLSFSALLARFTTAVQPIFGWGARNRVGSEKGRDPWSRIGSESAKKKGDGSIGGDDTK